MDSDTIKYNCGISIWDDESTTDRNITLDEPPTWQDLLNEFLHLLVGAGYVISYDKMTNILDAANGENED